MVLQMCDECHHSYDDESQTAECSPESIDAHKMVKPDTALVAHVNHTARANGNTLPAPIGTRAPQNRPAPGR